MSLVKRALEEKQLGEVPQLMMERFEPHKDLYSELSPEAQKERKEDLERTWVPDRLSHQGISKEGVTALEIDICTNILRHWRDPIRFFKLAERFSELSEKKLVKSLEKLMKLNYIQVYAEKNH